VFVSPELSEIKKIQVLHFPREPVTLNAVVDFIVKKNQTRGNVEVKLRYATKNVHTTEVPLQVIDADRYSVRFQPRHSGPLDVIVKFNGVEIPQSPLKLAVLADNIAESMTRVKDMAYIQVIKLLDSFIELPTHDPNTSMIKAIGLGLQTISLTSINEFTVDASKAGECIFIYFFQ
jgi:Filamin/ABP280 repeat